MTSSGPLEAFAKAQKLGFRESGSLPPKGDLPNRGGHVEGLRRFTIVVTAVPQSIGFMPSLGFVGAKSEMTGIGGSLGDVEQVDLGGHAGVKGSRCYRYRGASEMWTRRLFSPELIDWPARSVAT